MAIAFRDSLATTTGAGGGVTDFDSNKPTGTADGDLLLCFFGNRSGTAGSMTPPDGTWTLEIELIPSSGKHLLWWKVAGASEPSTHHWIDVATKWACVMVAYSGVNPTTPFHQKDSAVDDVGGTGPFTTPSIVTTITTWLVTAFQHRLTHTNLSWSTWENDPGDLAATERGDTNTTGTNGTSCAVADTNGTVAANTWTGTATPSETADALGEMILALNPASEGGGSPLSPLFHTITGGN
jgi:hypothetical protein